MDAEVKYRMFMFVNAFFFTEILYFVILNYELHNGIQVIIDLFCLSIILFCIYLQYRVRPKKKKPSDDYVPTQQEFNVRYGIGSVS
jgi:hypothetical protein